MANKKAKLKSETLKLKLEKERFKTFYGYLMNTTKAEPEASEFAQKILLWLLSSIRYKCYKKAYEEKPRYSITLSRPEAMAFVLVFSNDQQEFSQYQKTTLRQISSQLHQACI